MTVAEFIEKWGPVVINPRTGKTIKLLDEAAAMETDLWALIHREKADWDVMRPPIPEAELQGCQHPHTISTTAGVLCQDCGCYWQHIE